MFYIWHVTESLSSCWLLHVEQYRSKSMHIEQSGYVEFERNQNEFNLAGTKFR